MKKILFTIQWYPPKDSANVLCDQKIINELLKNEEYEIHCLTYQSFKQSLYENVDGVKVHRFKRSWFWDMYMWARANRNKKRAKFVWILNRIVLRIKQILTIPIYPCYEPLLAKKYAREAIKLHKNEQFDVVISEYNGFDTLYAGMRLKKEFPQIKFVPIFWDSLSGGFCAKYLPEKYCRHKKKRVEQKVLRVCDYAIAMTPHKQHMVELWKGTDLFDKIHFLNIPYLVKHDSIKTNTILDKNKINIVFAGSIHNREPHYIINLINHFNIPDVVFWFICDKSFHPILGKYININDQRIKVHHYIPNNELIDVLQNADFFLNMGVKNPNAISGKIFEYISFGKPIISTYSIDNEACLSYLEKYPLSLVLDERIDDVQKQVSVLEQFIVRSKGKSLSFDDVSEKYYENTPRAYTELIQNLIEKKEGINIDGKKH